MENQTEFKWYQKPAGVIILLIFFFPVGLYLMWKNELWTKQTRWIVTGVLALVVISNAGNDKNSNSNSGVESDSKINSGVESDSKITKVTFSEAEAFMQNRCNSTNQTLMKKRVSILMELNCICFYRLQKMVMYVSAVFQKMHLKS